MDRRALVVAALFGLISGFLVPLTGPDRRAVLITLGLTVTIGLGAWGLVEDSIAGPSLTIGGASTILVGLATPRLRRDRGTATRS